MKTSETVTITIPYSCDNDINVWHDYNAIVVEIDRDDTKRYFRRWCKGSRDGELEPISKATFEQHCVGCAFELAKQQDKLREEVANARNNEQAFARQSRGFHREKVELEKEVGQLNALIDQYRITIDNLTSQAIEGDRIKQLEEQIGALNVRIEDLIAERDSLEAKLGRYVEFVKMLGAEDRAKGFVALDKSKLPTREKLKRDAIYFDEKLPFSIEMLGGVYGHNPAYVVRNEKGEVLEARTATTTETLLFAIWQRLPDDETMRNLRPQP